jgi:hypothetical protein
MDFVGTVNTRPGDLSHEPTRRTYSLIGRVGSLRDATDPTVNRRALSAMLTVLCRNN